MCDNRIITLHQTYDYHNLFFYFHQKLIAAEYIVS
jgi:hypothetical protein